MPPKDFRIITPFSIVCSLLFCERCRIMTWNVRQYFDIPQQRIHILYYIILYYIKKGRI